MSENREPKKGTGPICRNGPEAGTDAQRWSAHKLDLSPSSCEEIRELLAALREDAITDAQARRLAVLLRESPEARRMYIHSMNLVANLLESVGKAAGAGFASTASGHGRKNDECRMMNDESPSRVATPVVHHSSFIIHHLPLVGSAGFSYISAVLMLAIAVFAAQWWSPLEGPRGPTALPISTAASDLYSARVVPGGVSPSVEGVDSELVIVGRITGMSNCRWERPWLAARVSDPVLQGRKYRMLAGLLEITYDSGAKVIVEGPAVFAAFNRNAGALYFGKMTASAGRLDRAKLIAGEKALGRPLPSLSVAAFCVHTPTAVVTDDGNEAAEFGVEVDRSKTTFARVYLGLITVGAAGFRGACPVSAGTCAWTGAGPKHESLFVFKPGPETSIFVTKMPKAPPVAVTRPAANGRAEKGG